MLPARAAFMRDDLRRSASLAQLELLETPSNFLSEVARSVVQLQRLLCAAQLHGLGEAHVLALALACSHSLHADASLRSDASDGDGGTLSVNERLLRRSCERAGLGSQTAQLLVLAAGDAAKQLLRANTQEAVERGAFGSPSALVTRIPRIPRIPDSAPPSSTRATQELATQELFFGSDRMEQLAHYLGLPYGGPQPQASLAKL